MAGLMPGNMLTVFKAPPAKHIPLTCPFVPKCNCHFRGLQLFKNRDWWFWTNVLQGKTGVKWPNFDLVEMERNSMNRGSHWTSRLGTWLMGKGHAHTHECVAWHNNDSSFAVELLRQCRPTLPAPGARRLSACVFAAELLTSETATETGDGGRWEQGKLKYCRPHCFYGLYHSVINASWTVSF